MSKTKVCVVGAGICGLSAAAALQNKSYSVKVLEKSKGLGGRMATRRTLNGKFDHGAQFYSLKEPIEMHHSRWTSLGLVQHWFNRNQTSCFAAPKGISALAKEISSTLDIQLEHRAIEVHRHATSWNIRCENLTDTQSDILILTAPLPQSIELLKNSGISYPDELNLITYSKAIVGLFENNLPSHFGPFFSGYTENRQLKPIFSISNQQSKLVSQIPSWTITMDAEFSEKFYDESDETVLGEILRAIHEIEPKFNSTEFQLKRWRYNFPKSTYPHAHLKIQEGLYLAGDAFGGASILGALRSASSVVSAL
jgi:renalase